MEVLYDVIGVLSLWVSNKPGFLMFSSLDLFLSESFARPWYIGI